MSKDLQKSKTETVVTEEPGKVSLIDQILNEGRLADGIDRRANSVAMIGGEPLMKLIKPMRRQWCSC